MHFLSHRSASDPQWQIYRELEQIPDTVPNPNCTDPWYTLGLAWVWRRLIAALVAELEAEDRLEEYLDRCWALPVTPSLEDSSSTLRKLWVLMD